MMFNNDVNNNIIAFLFFVLGLQAYQSLRVISKRLLLMNAACSLFNPVRRSFIVNFSYNGTVNGGD